MANRMEKFTLVKGMKEKKEVKAPAAPLLGAKGKRSVAGKMSLPPMIDNTINVTSTVIRYFISSSSAPVSCSTQDIFGALGGIAFTTTSVRPWAGSYRIRKVCAWPALSTTAGEPQVQLSWNGGLASQNRDEIKSVDIPRGNTTTGMVTFVPPKRALAGDWVSSTATTTTNLFTIEGAPGSVLDFHVSFTLSNAFLAAAITVGTATAGNPYYLALDGASSNTIIPAHLPTTS